MGCLSRSPFSSLQVLPVGVTLRLPGGGSPEAPVGSPFLRSAAPVTYPPFAGQRPKTPGPRRLQPTSGPPDDAGETEQRFAPNGNPDHLRDHRPPAGSPSPCGRSTTPRTVRIVCGLTGQRKDNHTDLAPKPQPCRHFIIAFEICPSPDQDLVFFVAEVDSFPGTRGVAISGPSASLRLGPECFCFRPAHRGVASKKDRAERCGAESSRASASAPPCGL